MVERQQQHPTQCCRQAEIIVAVGEHVRFIPGRMLRSIVHRFRQQSYLSQSVCVVGGIGRYSAWKQSTWTRRATCWCKSLCTLGWRFFAPLMHCPQECPTIIVYTDMNTVVSNSRYLAIPRRCLLTLSRRTRLSSSFFQPTGQRGHGGRR